MAMMIEMSTILYTHLEFVFCLYYVSWLELINV